MGYYTYYTMTAEDFVTKEPVSGRLAELLDQEVFDRVGVFEGGNCADGWYGSAKWYDHDRDMLILAWRFPGVLFTLHGEGDNQDDLWMSYYLNGRMQYCPAVITYEDFDPGKLEPAEKLDLKDPLLRYTYESY